MVTQINDAGTSNPARSSGAQFDKPIVIGTGSNVNPFPLADSDGDGVPDVNDAFPGDPNESVDTDNDGTGNNADPDDDNDGVADGLDFMPLNAARTMPIQPLFPNASGITDFPDHAAGNQIEWIMEQFLLPTTSLTEISDRFVSGFDYPGLQSFFDVLRTSYPNAQVAEVLLVTPRQAIIVVGDPTNPTALGGLIDMTVQFSDGRINYFFVQNFPQNPSSTGLADQGLGLQQISNKIKMQADETSLLIARIDESNQCNKLFGHDIDVARATGSIFKAWLLGALAQGVEDGVVTPGQTVPLDANEIVPVGEALSSEPLGTPFSMSDMAIMMMGTSDNTATDHMHELITRPRAEAILSQFNHNHADAMTPFLSINETFHLYWTVPEVDALAYANGTEMEQRDYLESVLEPLGPVTAFPVANASILVDGTWRASPMDLCNAIAAMRRYKDTSDAFALIDQAYGSNEGAWAARRHWERVWFKGGSLADSSGLLVLTYGWLLESDDRGAYVVIGMANQSWTSTARISNTVFFSAMSRVLDLVNEAF
ncbi:MAG: hypothetical protein HKN70_06660 [Gammaproteobacteria bacterium]|nr:hypothetical protein [Gammaproteobacteria bacterium]